MLSYLLKNDSDHILKKYILKYFYKIIFYFLKNLKNSQKIIEDENFYYFGAMNQSQFFKKLENEKNKKEFKLLIGFSYCQKPKNCPEIRFSNKCSLNEKDPECKNCEIGILKEKFKNFNPIIITTVNHFINELLTLKTQNPNKNIYFITSACKYSQDTFKKYFHLLNISGIGIKLKGRCCKTKKAFLIAEDGIKHDSTYLPKNALAFFDSLEKVLKI